MHKPIAVVADVHIGNRPYKGGPMVGGLNDRGRQSIEVFRRSVVEAHHRGAGLLAVAGDLFHKSLTEPAVYAAAQKVLREDAGSLPVILVPGNHDMCEATCGLGNTACEPLSLDAEVPNEVTWYSVPDVWCDVLCVPFAAPMTVTIAEAMAAHPGDPDRPKVLVTHVGISDESSPAWARRAPDAIDSGTLIGLMRTHGFVSAVVGNYHNHANWGVGPTVTQVGTLCPGSFSDEGLFPKRGGMWLLGPDGGELVEIPGPRFVERGQPEPPPAQGFRYFLREGDDVPLVQAIAEEATTEDPDDPIDAIRSWVESKAPPEWDKAKVTRLAEDFWRRS